METNDKVIWLIGEISQFLPEQVPTIGDVLRCFFYRFVYSKRKDPSFIDVAKQLKVHWSQLEKKAVEQRDVVQRIRKLVEMYDAVNKGKHRRTPKQLNYEKQFLQVLNQVFDIAPKVNYHTNKNQDLVQIQNFNFTTGEINDSVALKSDNTYCQNDVLNSIADENNDIEMGQVEDENNIDFETTLSVYYKLQFSSDILDEESDNDIVYKIINSPDVASALDRTNTATGSFVIILAAIARALEVDLTECVFSASTLL